MDYWGGAKGMLPPPPQIIGGGVSGAGPPLPTPMILWGLGVELRKIFYVVVYVFSSY